MDPLWKDSPPKVTAVAVDVFALENLELLLDPLLH
jgi:hypothetical protein